MAHFETFTNQTPGTAPDTEGRVEICPRCGRPGVERRIAAGRVFVHTEASEILSDGLLTVPVESCPLGPLPFDVRDPDVI